MPQGMPRGHVTCASGTLRGEWRFAQPSMQRVGACGTKGTYEEPAVIPGCAIFFWKPNNHNPFESSQSSSGREPPSLGSGALQHNPYAGKLPLNYLPLLGGQVSG